MGVIHATASPKTLGFGGHRYRYISWASAGQGSCQNFCRKQASSTQVIGSAINRVIFSIIRFLVSEKDGGIAMGNELFGYARVSTTDQRLDRQIDELLENGVSPDHIFTDKMTGGTTSRPAFEALQARLREGDVVTTDSLSRLSRSMKDLLQIIEDWNHRGVQYISLKENIDFSSSTGKFLLGVLASVSELERNLIKDRVKEGIASARARGRVGGRKPTDAGKIAKAMKLYDAKTHSLAEIREITGVSQSVLYRALRRRKIAEGLDK